MNFKVNPEIFDWQSLDVGVSNLAEDELQNLLEFAGHVTDSEEKEFILKQIDGLHHYLELEYGRNYHTLTAFLSNYEHVYEMLEQKSWRSSYLMDEIPHDVNNALKTEKLSVKPLQRLVVG